MNRLNGDFVPFWHKIWRALGSFGRIGLKAKGFNVGVDYPLEGPVSGKGEVGGKGANKV